jgi:hypothetical protein
MTIYVLGFKVSRYGDNFSFCYCFLYFLTYIFAVRSGMRGIVCFQDVRNQDWQRVPITSCASVRTLQLGRKNDALIDPLHFRLKSKANDRRIGNVAHFINFTFTKAKVTPNNCNKNVAFICK